MALPLVLNPDDPLPLYAQLERAIKVAIATGGLQAGQQLPTVRQLAVDLKINANTVAKVYAELERQEVLLTRRGVGTFVAVVHPQPQSRRQRSAELRALAERFLAEAAGLGFSPQELIALTQRLSEKPHGRR
jgi:GntR family transcriptional regulator